MIKVEIQNKELSFLNDKLQSELEKLEKAIIKTGKVGFTKTEILSVRQTLAKVEVLDQNSIFVRYQNQLASIVIRPIVTEVKKCLISHNYVFKAPKPSELKTLKMGILEFMKSLLRLKEDVSLLSQLFPILTIAREFLKIYFPKEKELIKNFKEELA